MASQTVKVEISSQNQAYEIITGRNISENIPGFISKVTNAKKFLIVTTPSVFDGHVDKLNIKNAEIFVIPEGEQHKNFETVTKILNKAFELGFDRNDAFIAFGGGIVGDMTGFAASIYKRGIDFIQIPTTLLAQVDASIGGKTAVNNDFGKNLVGTFYQPKIVISDISFLETLDERQFKTGLAEIVKYAFIEKNILSSDDNFLNFLEKNRDKIISRDEDILLETVAKCAKLKALTVSSDEKEKGLRQILNFGHTFAHAFEKCGNYTEFTHGEAVAIGMKLAFSLSLELGFVDENYFNLANSLIDKFAIIPENYPKYPFKELINAMEQDKKVKNGKINFVLPSAKGTVTTFVPDDLNIIRKIC